MALFISFILVSLVAGPFQGLIAVLGFGVLGIVLGVVIKRKMSLLEIMVIGSFFSFISKILLMFIGLWLLDVNPLLIGLEEIDQSINQSLSFYQNIGISPEQMEAFKNTLLQSVELIKIALPAMLILASVFDTIINYWVTEKILERLGYSLKPMISFQQWRVGPSFFWSYVAGMFLLIINTRYNLPVIQRIGLNIQLLFSIIFLITGLALISYTFNYFKIKTFFFWIICFLIFMQPFLSLIVTWIGIFDVWLDFRKLISGGQKT